MDDKYDAHKEDHTRIKGGVGAKKTKNKKLSYGQAQYADMGPDYYSAQVFTRTPLGYYNLVRFGQVCTGQSE